MRFLDKKVLKQKFDHKLMINEINFSMLESTSTSDYEEMDNDVSKSKVLEPTIKHLIKQPSLDRRAARNLVRRGKSTREEISLMEKVTLK